MRPIIPLIVAAGIVSGLASCSDDNSDIAGGTGSIALSVEVDASVSDSRSDGGAPEGTGLPSASDFSLTLSDMTGAYSHTWASVSEFPTDEQYRTGEYQLTASYGSVDTEGFESPCYQGSTTVSVREAAVTQATVVCTLANTMVSVDCTQAFQSYFKEYSTTIHSSGGAYLDYPAGETRPLYLKPGDVSLTLHLTLPDGSVTTFQPASIADAQARHHYHVHLDVNGGNVGSASLKVTIDGTLEPEEISVDLSGDLIAAPAPEVKAVGFTAGTPLNHPEGDRLSGQVAMDINARNGIESVMLTTHSATLAAKGWPAEIDLTKADEATKGTLTALGLDVKGLWQNIDRMAIVDFTKVIEKLSFDATDPTSTFTIVVKDKLTKVNEPVTLSVNTQPVDLTLKSVGPAVIGVNKSRFEVGCPGNDPAANIEVMTADGHGGWTTAPISNITREDNGMYTFDVAVPEGSGASIEARVYYCGNLKATVRIMRKSPEYSLEIDPFATRARVKVIAREASVMSLVTDYLRVYVNGKPASVLERDATTGMLVVGGLNPSTVYSVQGTVVDDPAEGDFTGLQTFRTEGRPGIPNGDFEDVKQTIDYSGMPSGGYYSQNTVEIYNRLNRKSFKVSTPVNWGNTNSKTFSGGASNRNTWYMQPSVETTTDAHSGGYAVALTSVAYDLNGPEIAPYVQPGEPFTPYSMNIPRIASRAAGTLLLGGYSFDAVTKSESYSPGIAFDARPSALNGFYKFTPCATAPNERGIVEIAVSGYDNGTEVILASGRMMLPLATGYTAFSIPLTYSHFGIKASRLRILISSSSAHGTITEETSRIVTLDDPVSASSRGATLYIDNLSLSY